jgi:hypothetical protein
MSVEAQIELNRQKSKEKPEPFTEVRSSLPNIMKSSFIEKPRSEMPYAALNSKDRMKQLTKTKHEAVSEDSEWSSSDSESDETHEEAKELTLKDHVVMAEGWVEEITLEGQVYYRNEISKEVRWDPPVTSQSLAFDNEWVWIPHLKEAFVPAKLVRPMEGGKYTVQKVGEKTPTELTVSASAQCVPLVKSQLSHITHVSST